MFLISETEREQKGISFPEQPEIGDITFHGPEQLVRYPILILNVWNRYRQIPAAQPGGG